MNRQQMLQMLCDYCRSNDCRDCALRTRCNRKSPLPFSGLDDATVEECIDAMCYCLVVDSTTEGER